MLADRVLGAMHGDRPVSDRPEPGQVPGCPGPGAGTPVKTGKREGELVNDLISNAEPPSTRALIRDDEGQPGQAAQEITVFLTLPAEPSPDVRAVQLLRRHIAHGRGVPRGDPGLRKRAARSLLHRGPSGGAPQMVGAHAGASVDNPVLPRPPQFCQPLLHRPHALRAVPRPVLE